MLNKNVPDSSDARGLFTSKKTVFFTGKKTTLFFTDFLTGFLPVKKHLSICNINGTRL